MVNGGVVEVGVGELMFRWVDLPPLCQSSLRWWLVNVGEVEVWCCGSAVVDRWMRRRWSVILEGR